MEQLSLIGEDKLSLGGCGNCLCKTCLYWWSGRCPHGECFDDWRAKHFPYPYGERRSWSAWKEPGEQDHWCRGGSFYPHHECEKYRKYTNCTVRTCLLANIEKFQDGYIRCSLIETMGCEECYKRFEESI